MESVKTFAPARAQAPEALRLERELGNLVNEAYGLTPEEVALTWKTEQPQMPYSQRLSQLAADWLNTPF